MQSALKMRKVLLALKRNNIKRFVRSPKDHDDPAGWHTVLCVANESLQSGTELLPGVSVLPLPGPPVGIFRDKREGRHDDAIPEERRLHEIRLLDLRQQVGYRHVFMDEHGTAVQRHLRLYAEATWQQTRGRPTRHRTPKSGA